MPVRTATNADIDQLLRYEHLNRENLARCVADGRVYALLFDGAIKGVLRYSLFWETIPFLDLIYIEESVRGRRLGAESMRFWETEMKRMGYSDVMTSTQADETARYFYERIGYKLIGSFLPPGQEANELMYSKRLTDFIHI